MQVVKRNGKVENFVRDKIFIALLKAFQSLGIIDESIVEELANIVTDKIKALKVSEISIEEIQDLVEKTLMENNHYEVMKAYILYREKQSQNRESRCNFLNEINMEGLKEVLKTIQNKYVEKAYDLRTLYKKYISFRKPMITDLEKIELLIKAAVELTTEDAPKWEFIAGALQMYSFNLKLKEKEVNLEINNFYQKVIYLANKGLYGKYIVENYTKEEIIEASKFIDYNRNYSLTYSSLDLLLRRYVIMDYDLTPLENVQEMFLGISLHLALKEKDKLKWVKKFYDTLSKLEVTMATPTLSNARKPYHQLSSCFIDTVPDSLDGIYRSIDNFAKVSKLGGGMGLYFGKVRSNGSSIRGFKGAAGGVIRWIKLANDTAVAVDQLGVRQGAVAVYLDVWHKDILDFLQLKTNNGDDRRKAHDVFPAVCYPDLFWRTLRDDINANWYLFDPHEVKSIKGYALEDSYGEEWESKYWDCVNDESLSKQVVPIKEIIRLVIKSSVETGTPFTFNRDHVNRMNPNKHKGIIYCSNLCTEIAQNMSEIELVSREIETENGEVVVVEVTKPGDFVVCNLASLALGNINTNNEEELSDIVSTTVRALDNVIDLNYYPLPYAQVTNSRYRPIGLGVSGYHHMLAKNLINWESEEHLNYADKVFETINYSAVKASMEISKEKGKYEYFEGSDWHNGKYFDMRNYKSEKWQDLKNDVNKYGMRNGYLLAIAPTSSTSIIATTTAGLDPIMQKFFLEEKKNGLVPRVAPDLNSENFWLYKSAHTINHEWTIKACGVRSRHVDQAQSLNVYITNDYSFRNILDLYIMAWENEVKTLYYIRSKALEVDECESCSS